MGGDQLNFLLIVIVGSFSLLNIIILCYSFGGSLLTIQCDLNVAADLLPQVCSNVQLNHLLPVPGKLCPTALGHARLNNLCLEYLL